MSIRCGTICSTQISTEGTIFYAQSHPNPAGEKLRIHAIFDTILEENTSVCTCPNSRDMRAFALISSTLWREVDL